MSDLRERLRQFVRAYEEELSDDPYGRGLIEETIAALAELADLKKPVEDAEVQAVIANLKQRIGMGGITQIIEQLARERFESNTRLAGADAREKALIEQIKTAEAENNRIAGRLQAVQEKLETAEAKVKAGLKSLDRISGKGMVGISALEMSDHQLRNHIDYLKSKARDDAESIRNMGDKGEPICPRCGLTGDLEGHQCKGKGDD